jgi:Tol biopolymer transport system component
MRFRLSVLVLLGVLVALPLPGAAQYFGRNKVQYRSFDFDIIRTDHFDIYYYQQEREAALDAARIAERSYARLSRILQLEFRERKPVVLYASHTDFQQTNISYGLIDESTGAFAEAIKSRMVLPFTGSYADFDHVFTHELVHAFQFDVVFRRDPNTESNATVARLPLWFMEGMAEYLSIGRIDPLTVSWLRDATLHGYLRDIGQMTQRDDYLSYRFGQSLWHYIGSKWGDEVVGILLQRAPRAGLERAFSSTLGISLAELSQEWMAAVRKTYLPQLADRARPESFSQKLTQHNRLQDAWYVSPAISPDGRHMVYLSQQDGFFFDLWLADAQTGRPLQKLIKAARSADFESLRFMTSGATFSPDGRYLAFSAQTGGQDALYLYDLKQRRVLRKLKFALDGIESPSFSPDSRSIVFSGNSGGLSDLFITDFQGRLTRLTKDRNADLLPSWSPDGKTIAFTTDRGPGMDFARLTYGNYRVALYDIASQTLTILPHQERGKNLNPVWAPDSKSLVWVNDASGTNNLHLFDLQTQQLYRISDLLSGVIAIKEISPVLSWSRSGKLLYTSFEKAGYNIYSVSDPRTLPRLPAGATPPVVAAVVGGGARTSNPATGSSAPLPVEPLLRPASAGSNGSNGTALGASKGDSATTSFYRSGQSFRASEKPAAQPIAQRPVSVSALLDSATLALPDTTSFKHRDYKVRFTPDIVGRPSVGAQVGGIYGSGVSGGSYIALSDILGNHNILMSGSVNGSLSDGAFFGAYNFLKPRANIGIMMEQLPLYYYYGSGRTQLDVGGGQAEDVAANVFVRDVIRMAAAFISYPFSSFRRLELGASGVMYQSDMLYVGQFLRTGEPMVFSERVDNLSYLQPAAALVFDNSLFGWTGPIDGRRYRAQLSRAFGGFQFTEALLDFRNYWNFKRRAVLALRLTGLARVGDDANRFSAFWGGPYYLRGYDSNSFELEGVECQKSRSGAAANLIGQCPARDQLIGSSVAFVNAELRVPIIKELQVGMVGGFPPVDLVTFFDAGVAWDSNICLQTRVRDPRRCAPGQTRSVDLTWKRREGQDPYLVREPLMSYGVGLRLNIFYTVLRLDYAIPLNRPDFDGFGGGVFSVSLGPSF